jgi:hypothetical protein
MLDVLGTSRGDRADAPRAVLVVGHPGHELRVYGWMAAARPIVHVLTDGSGGTGKSRIDSTSAVLDGVGASRGGIYGRMSDRGIYAAMLDGDHDRFLALVDELADSFVRDRIDVVVGDAVEGFNPSHDVCRYVINAAVRVAAVAAQRPIACYAFPLDGAPAARPPGVGDVPVTVELDDRTLERKLQAAHGYAELKAEVDRALDQFGADPFRTEYLWPADLADPYIWDSHRVPFYESYGAQRVASGAYHRVVTFGQHVRPLADALWCRCAVSA